MTDSTKAFSNCATGEKRAQLAERFTSYLKSRDTKDNAYVVNLNGAWGTGKTYFITEWKKLVESHGHIAIKIDAWESDYLNDPLAIIIAELLEQVRANIKNYDAKFRNAERNVASAILNMGKNTFSIGSKIVGKHLLGEAATSEIIDLIAAATDSIIKHEKVQDDLNMGDLGLDVVNQHKRHKQFTQDFKKQARDLVDFALEDNPNKQVFIFIDELDRCRPTYAIEMLETVKHLFDIPNFIFVLSTDTNQLQHSIKAVYGNEFDSHEYLSRFFEQRLTLPELGFFEFLTAEAIFDNDDFEPLPTLPAIDTVEQLRAAVALICEQNKPQLSLRRVKQICAQLEVVLNSKELRENAYPILTLIGLVFGNALYGGKSGTENSLQNARLALHGSNSPIRAFNKVTLFKDNNEGAFSITLDEAINSCLTSIENLVSRTPSKSQFIPKSHNNYLKALNIPTKLLFDDYYMKLLTCEQNLNDNYGKETSIITERELLKVIEDLNILSDTPEEQL